MKTIRRSAILLVLVLFCTPLLSGQSLSSYRKFSLGTSLAAVSKQVGQDPLRADLIHQSPALIQQMTYWPIETAPYSTRAESVSQVLFSFYNGDLYKISVTYDQQATEGLTEDDMVEAISSRYGTATRLYPEIALPTSDQYAPSSKVIARWENSETSVNLFRTNSLNTFGLSVYSKKVDAQADAAITESAKLEQQQAPQKEIDRQKGEADKLEAARLKNVKAFRF
jgi:hypothetical protein